MRLIATILMLFALLGCAKEYVIKPTDPTAFVRFTTNTSENTVFLHVPQEAACTDSSGQMLAKFNWLEGKQLSEIRMLGSTGEPSDRAYERLAVAGQPFYILAWSDRTAGTYSAGHHCSVGAKTVWQPGQHYEVSFTLNNGSCRWILHNYLNPVAM